MINVERWPGTNDTWKVDHDGAIIGIIEQYGIQDQKGLTDLFARPRIRYRITYTMNRFIKPENKCDFKSLEQTISQVHIDLMGVL